MLDLLKKSGNPYYQFHDDYQRFKERCKIEDPDGYTMIFPDTHNEHTDEEILTNQLLSDDDIDNDNSNHSNYASSQNSDTEDIDSDLKSELDFIANDPVRRFQFNYNETLCMAHKYPEIEVQDKTKIIEIAPGEGKKTI